MFYIGMDKYEILRWDFEEFYQNLKSYYDLI